MPNAHAWPFLAVLVAALPCVSSAQAESYVINPRKTEVRFSYMMGLLTQRGRFSKVDGLLKYDERAPEKSEVVAKIATASVETGQPIVDDELKGVNFFNAKGSPELIFRSRSVKPKTQDQAEITGEMTINGVTLPVTLDVVLTAHEDPALKYSAGSKKFLAKTTISRSAFNMTSYADMVGDEIGIEIDAVVRPKH